MNEDSVKIHTLNCLVSFLAHAFKHRITYNQLVGAES